MKNLIILALISTLYSCAPSSNNGRNPASKETDGLAETQLRIFITSSTHTGNLGGIAGANEICQNLAEAQGLDRDYKALISISTNSAVDRIDEDGEIYIFESKDEKFLVAKNLDELFDADTTNLEHALNRDEKFNELTSEHLWTGTNSNGSADAENNCTNWTDETAGVDGLHGDSSSVSSSFLEDSFDDCDQEKRLICISQ